LKLDLIQKYTKDKVDNAEEKGEREATMILIRAIADCELNKIALPVNHAPFFDEDMNQGTLLFIPIMETGSVLDWKKGDSYSVLVVADSVRTYHFCEMDSRNVTAEAKPEDIVMATQFVTDCILGLGDSLASHSFEPITKGTRTDRFSGKNADNRQEWFNEKVEATKTLKNCIKGKQRKVLIPAERDFSKVQLLKIDFGNISGVRPPDPLLLGLKSGLGLQKYAATRHPTMYKSETISAKDCSEYAESRGSMMLAPACGESDYLFAHQDGVVESDEASSCGSASSESSEGRDVATAGMSTPPREITVVRAVTPDSDEKN
jgi:hypothetical protein